MTELMTASAHAADAEHSAQHKAKHVITTQEISVTSYFTLGEKTLEKTHFKMASTTVHFPEKLRFPRVCIHQVVFFY